MQITFETIAESSPGAKWRAVFDRHWPDYRAWFLSRRRENDPSLSNSVRKLRRYMPELSTTYEQLVELAGGDDLAARFLSCYRPPAYLSGCSQAVWSRSDEPVLIRNYDLDPALHEGIILHSAWNGRQVIAINECLWGADDGMNDAGLVVSITFGGRNIVGDGFGIPIIVRYILELCETTAEAVEVLRRVPSHMAYNVTLLDRQGDYATAFVSPDRPTQVTRKPVATNHQQSIEWPEHARFSKTLERERFLTERLAEAGMTQEALLQAFLRAPLFNTHYRHGFGTLYTAIYRPLQGRVELHWPDGSWRQSFENFEESKRTVRYSQFAAAESRQAPGSIALEARQGEETPRFRFTWELEDFGAAGIMKQVFTGVLDTFDVAGNPAPDRLRRELMDDLERGHIPWEKLGTLWIGSDESPFESRVEARPESAD